VLVVLQEFLVQFGYLLPAALQPNSGISNSKMETMVKEALTNFQMFYGLPQTGKSNCMYIFHN
jgi:hypothetical protein